MNNPPLRRPALAALLAALSALSSPALRAFDWTGAAGSDFSAAASWTGPAPVAGKSNQGDLYVLNGDDAPLIYTEAQGVTRFDCSDFKIGNSKKPGGSLLVTGGELVVTSFWAPMIGHNNNRTGTRTLTGGRLVINSRAGAKPGERSLRVGNWRGTNTRGVLNITGGVMEVNTPGEIALGGLVVACDDASGDVMLGGGLLVVTSIFGTSFQPQGGRGIGTLTFGPGDGVFMQTESKQLIFGSGGGEDSCVNFLRGSRGQLSLAGATRADFEAWVLAGKIRIDSRFASPSEFTYSQLENQGSYQLAARAPALAVTRP